MLCLFDEVMFVYEKVFNVNQNFIFVLNVIGMLFKGCEVFDKVFNYFCVIMQFDVNNGEVWGNFGKLIYV